MQKESEVSAGALCTAQRMKCGVPLPLHTLEEGSRRENTGVCSLTTYVPVPLGCGSSGILPAARWTRLLAS